jgi:hypothetical protein
VRIGTLLFGFSVLAATTVEAQSSQFEIRGLGLPNRGASVRAMGTSGAFSMFDATSTLSPASVGMMSTLTATFAGTSEWRQWRAPASFANLRDNRFPYFVVGGPIKRSHMVLAGGYSSYTDRDFDVVVKDTVTLRGQPVEVTDSLSSTGGISDVQLVGAYLPSSRWIFGASLHLLPGSSRMKLRRVFSDSSFHNQIERAEIAYKSYGTSLGVIGRLAERVSVAAVVRHDAPTHETVDSLSSYTIELPYTFGGAILVAPSGRLQVAAQAIYRTWSSANQDLIALGGVGSRNTIDLSAGLEFRTHLYVDDLPIRFGVRYANLPFALTTGDWPDELGLSLGTGMRFARGHGGIDATLQEIYRSDGTGRKEYATLVSIAVILRP